MYFRFFDEGHNTEAAFDQQMDSLMREIGERGRQRLPEAVPPTMMAPVRPMTTAVAPSPSRLDSSFTPSMHQSPVATRHEEGHNLEAMSVFFAQQQDKLEAWRQEMEQRLREEIADEITRRQVISSAQIAALGLRLESLHASKLLSGEELEFV